MATGAGSASLAFSSRGCSSESCLLLFFSISLSSGGFILHPLQTTPGPALNLLDQRGTAGNPQQFDVLRPEKAASNFHVRSDFPGREEERSSAGVFVGFRVGKTTDPRTRCAQRGHIWVPAVCWAA